MAMNKFSRGSLIALMLCWLVVVVPGAWAHFFTQAELAGTWDGFGFSDTTGATNNPGCGEVTLTFDASGTVTGGTDVGCASPGMPLGSTSGSATVNSGGTLRVGSTGIPTATWTESDGTVQTIAHGQVDKAPHTIVPIVGSRTGGDVL